MEAFESSDEQKQSLLKMPLDFALFFMDAYAKLVVWKYNRLYSN